ncbi:unnamed protein product [Ceutorhynchus assimilis]|uniref:Aminopeptidase n=1 Tax=Ceutorhynchus assimilis TaxID=467358 RepID=A0A9N9MES3_9CUCU|nr:unnamed protein product [Ceutorhynchus assimilis]
MDHTIVLILFGVQIITAKELTYRLSRDVIPKHYSLKLQPDIDAETFRGEVTITIYSTAEKERIILHSLNLNITFAEINQHPAKVEELEDARIAVSFINRGHIQPGEHLIRFKYHGRLYEQFGLRKASYKYNSHKGHLIVNEFEAHHARKAFPCFDEPNFKARFNVRLITPNDSYIALSNMPEIGRYPFSEGILYVFATTVKMSTYLVSLAITDYTYYEEMFVHNNKTIPIRVYTYNASKENNHAAIEAAMISIRYYNDYTGLDYPLPKLDMIEYDKGKVTATETWGLIQFKEGLLTTDLDIYDAFQCHLVIFHELGHFWFGNLVTNDWWNDLWLQEGFATFMSYKMIAEREDVGISKLFRLIEVIDMDTQFREDKLQLVSYLHSTDYMENDKLFDGIVYTKGAYLLRMLEVLVGEKLFQQIVRNFLKNHEFGTVTTNDLIQEFEDQVPYMDIRSFMESYIYQYGHPVLNVDDSSEKYVLSQILANNSSNKWTIPISYAYANNTTGYIWFDREAETITLDKSVDSEFMLFNLGSKPGIYIVNYTDTMLRNILDNIGNFPLEDLETFEDNMKVLYQMKYINCDTVLEFFGAMQNQSTYNSLFFYAVLDVFQSISCYKQEYRALIEHLNTKYKIKIDLFIPESYGKCDENRNTTDISDLHSQQCIQWISNNLLNANETQNIM